MQGKPVLKLADVVGKSKPAPNFGPYHEKKMAALAEEKAAKDLLGENKSGIGEERPGNAPGRKIRSVQEVIGTALDRIGTYNDLDNK